MSLRILIISLGAGYTIPDIPYFHSFLADNDSNGAQNEVMFTIPFDGLELKPLEV